jgi:myo-inositol-1(or 4)-monophosphatase
MTDRVAVARRAAERGADEAIERFEQGVAVDTKGKEMDYVTEADLAAQEAVVGTIRESYPEDAIVGEEGDELKRVPETGDAWIVDPIDGTTNFLHGLKTWAAAVAAVRDGDPVASTIAMPAHGDTYVGGGVAEKNGAEIGVSDRTEPETFVAAPILRYTVDDAHRERFARLAEAMIHTLGDVRRLGCAQATLAMVAAGSIDATIGPFEPAAWDTVAGAHMVDLAGGTVTDLGGEPWTADSDGIVASNGRAHTELLEILAAYGLDS